MKNLSFDTAKQNRGPYSSPKREEVSASTLIGAQIGLMGRTLWRPMMEELRLTKLELHNWSYKGKNDESKLLNALTEVLPP